MFPFVADFFSLCRLRRALRGQEMRYNIQISVSVKKGVKRRAVHISIGLMACVIEGRGYVGMKLVASRDQKRRTRGEK